jgi:hypothetical protein
MFPFRKAPRLPRNVEEVFERALVRLDAKPLKWKGVTLVFERRGVTSELNTAEHLEILDNAPANTPVDGMAIYLGTRLGLPLPDDLALNLAAVRPWLRPRVLHTRVLEGPSRSMCRRPAFAPVTDDADDSSMLAPAPDLITAVGIGAGRTATYVTTRALDAWGLGFDDVLAMGLSNLRSILSPSDLRDVEGAEGVLAVTDPTLETGAAASLVLDHLLPEAHTAHGVLFAVPAEDTTLAMAVRAGAGARSLASLVQVVYSIAAETDAPLCETIFWMRSIGPRLSDTAVVAIPMTSVQEGGARRVHLEAHGVVEDLLRILGEIE